MSMHKADDIFNAVCTLTGVTPEQFVASHLNAMADARAILVGVMRHYCTRLSFPDISRSYMGRECHGTAFAACQRFMALPLREREGWLFRVAVLAEAAAGNRAHEERESCRLERQLRWCVPIKRAKAKRMVAA